MIKFKYYRYIRTLFGWRSFVKKDDMGDTYALVKGPDKAAKVLLSQGYIEEWPADRIGL